MKKFEIINNSLVISDTITGELYLDMPKSNLYYMIDLWSNQQKIDIVDLSSNHNNSVLHSFLISEAIDSQYVNFTLETFINFARGNLGFKTASGGSDAIVYLSDNFTALNSEDTTYLQVGNLAYVNESQGTAWLPGAIGGSYYPNGFYLWSGTEWISDRNAIANQLHININELNNKQNVLVSGTNIKTINGSTILGSGDLSITLDNTSTANSTNVGRFRYYVSGGFSFLECCMQTGTTTYEWILISQQEIL